MRLDAVARASRSRLLEAISVDTNEAATLDDCILIALLLLLLLLLIATLVLSCHAVLVEPARARARSGLAR